MKIGTIYTNNQKINNQSNGNNTDTNNPLA